MSPILVRALLLDALYQVLDNKVFRILVIVAGLIVVVPLFVGFQKEEIEVLFGMWSFSYEKFLNLFGGMAGPSGRALASMSSTEVQELCVQTYQSLLIDQFMGSVGIFICLAATAFFIPRMIEKGAADTIFSKPVSRLTLLLARYFTGVLFVAILACLLIFGTHFALLIGSGISDPAFLWNALTLTYTFALLYAVTVLIGVVTRSTVAAILLTIIFMTFNSCVHGSWKLVQMNMDGERESSEAIDEGPGFQVTVNGEPMASGEDETYEVSDDAELLFDSVWTGTRVLHYALPKTDDASAIAAKLRGSFASDEDSPFKDDEMAFELKSLPPGFAPVDPASIDSSVPRFPPAEGAELVFAARDASTGARLLVERRPVREVESSPSGRMRRESSRSAEKSFSAWLEADESRAEDSLERINIAEGTTWTQTARDFHWTAFRPDGTWKIRTLLVREGDWFASIQLEVPEGVELSEAVGEQFGGRDYMFGSGSLTSLQASLSPGAWYAEKLDWTGPFEFTIWFSLGSSLAFVMATLALAWWRLSRIDF